MADDAPPTPTTAAPTGTTVAEPPVIEMPAENARALPTDLARLAEARNQLRQELTSDIEAELQLSTSAQTQLKADIAAADARLAATDGQIADLKVQMQKHEAEIARLQAESDPLGDGSLDAKAEAGEDLARHQAALRAQQNVLDQLQHRVEETTSSRTSAQAAVESIETEWAAKRQGFEEAERQLDRLDEKILVLGDQQAADDAAVSAEETARELEASGDTAGAAQHRAIAAQHRADAAAKAAQAAAIDVDPQVLVDAGLDIPVVTTVPTEADGSTDGSTSDAPTGTDGTTDTSTDTPTGTDGTTDTSTTDTPTGADGTTDTPTEGTTTDTPADATGDGSTDGTDATGDPATDAPTATPTTDTPADATGDGSTDGSAPAPAGGDGSAPAPSPGEIEMEPEFVGRSPEGSALAEDASKLRDTLLERLGTGHAELTHRADRLNDQVTAAKATQASAEKDITDYKARLDQIDQDEQDLWKKLSEMDEDADPAAYAEVLEDVRTHMAAADRQRNLIESRTADVEAAKADVARLEPEHAAAVAEADAFGTRLREAEAEIDVMERRATALDDQYRNEQNARTFTDLAAQASDRGDEAEAKRLRQRAVEALDGANAAGAVLDANPLTPKLIDDAGLRSPADPAAPGATDAAATDALVDGLGSADGLESADGTTDVVTPVADPSAADSSVSDPAFDSVLGATTDAGTVLADPAAAPAASADGDASDDIDTPAAQPADFDPTGVDLDGAGGDQDLAPSGDGDQPLVPTALDDATGADTTDPGDLGSGDLGSGDLGSGDLGSGDLGSGDADLGDLGAADPGSAPDPGYGNDLGAADPGYGTDAGYADDGGYADPGYADDSAYADPAVDAAVDPVDDGGF